MKIARIHGFRRYAVRDAFYPGLWYDKNTIVKGQFILGLSTEEIACIDRYEGTEYQKSLALVLVDGIEHKTMIYLRAPQDEEEWMEDWDEVRFAKEGRMRFTLD